MILKKNLSKADIEHLLCFSKSFRQQAAVFFFRKK